jgi:hypothetical protein
MTVLVHSIVARGACKVNLKRGNDKYSNIEDFLKTGMNVSTAGNKGSVSLNRASAIVISSEARNPIPGNRISTRDVRRNDDTRRSKDNESRK